MMIRALINFTLLLFWLTGQLVRGGVQQDPPSLLQQSREPATLHCSHNISSYNMILWYRQPRGAGALELLGYLYHDNKNVEPPMETRLKLEGDGKKSGTMTISSVTSADGDAVYFCAASEEGTGTQAYFGNGTKLTVLEPDIEITRPTVKVLPPSNLEDCKKKKKKLTLVCVATGFYPDHITVFWKLNGANLTSGVRTDDTALRNGSDGFYSITSRLRVPSKKWFDTRNSFTCLTSFYDGETYLEDEDSIKGVNGGGMDREYFLKSGVTAKLSYSLFIAKSFLYGLFISAVVWKIRSSAAKHYE